jgi:hypothetical protein
VATQAQPSEAERSSLNSSNFSWISPGWSDALASFSMKIVGIEEHFLSLAVRKSWAAD